MLPTHNPKVSEQINNAHEHPLKDALLLTLGALGILVAISFLIGWSAAWVAPLIPYEWEPNISIGQAIKNNEAIKLSEEDACIESSLQALTDSLIQFSNDQRPVQVYWLPQMSEANAFATSGGNIHITAGLLQAVDNENALSMVLAHEYAHIELRHPLTMMIQQAGNLLLAFFSGLGESLIGLQQNTSWLTTLSFSRDMEREADQLALSLLTSKYGHTGGSEGFFEKMLNVTKESKLTGLLSTHPGLDERIETIKNQANIEANLTPLSGCLKHSESFE